MVSSVLEAVEVNPAGKPAACVIWLHGLGADGHDFEPIVPALSLPGTVSVRFVFPHAPVRSVTINDGMRMRAWYDILELLPDHRIDVPSFLDSCERLGRLIEQEIATSGIPAEKVILAGFSQGGAIALHTGLRYPERLCGILALSTYLPTSDSLALERSEANRDIPIFMVHGTRDTVIPIAYAEATRKKLAALGYSVQWHAYPMEHAACDEEVRDIRSWILRVLTAPLVGRS